MSAKFFTLGLLRFRLGTVEAHAIGYQKEKETRGSDVRAKEKLTRGMWPVRKRTWVTSQILKCFLFGTYQI